MASTTSTTSGELGTQRKTTSDASATPRRRPAVDGALRHGGVDGAPAP